MMMNEVRGDEDDGRQSEFIRVCSTPVAAGLMSVGGSSCASLAGLGWAGRGWAGLA